MRKFTVKEIVLIGISAAIIFAATKIFIPFGIGGAMVHLGSAAIFTIAILFGARVGGLSAAIASLIVDLMGAYPIYAPWSFVIKGTVGFAIGLIAHHYIINQGEQKMSTKSLLVILMADLVGATLMLAGYLVAWRFVLGSWVVAIGNAPASLMTSSMGVISSIFLAFPLLMALKKSRFYDTY